MILSLCDGMKPRMIRQSPAKPISKNLITDGTVHFLSAESEKSAVNSFFLCYPYASAVKTSCSSVSIREIRVFNCFLTAKPPKKIF